MRRVLFAIAIAVPIVAAITWVVWFSPWLAVARVEVSIAPTSEAAGPLPEDEIRFIADIPPGTPLLQVSTGDIEERIAALPQVRSVTVSRAWPDTVAITVLRRDPVALVASASGYDLVDEDGVVIRTVPSVIADVPVVRATGAGVIAAVTVAGEVPAWLSDTVDEIEASTRNNVTLRLRNGATVMWGSAGDTVFKAEVLQTLLQVKAQRYDVSAPGVPATSDGSVMPSALPSD
ncbi:MAG: FtsQ-type POTRA domain-containing protein [Candidatus Nanopelagicales bacterium]